MILEETRHVTDIRKQGGSTRSLKTILSLGVGMAAIALSAPAVAQDTTDDGDGTRKLQTVTITATKREQTLQDVPIAVSVVDDAVIEKAEIIDMFDLQSVVPSLQVTQNQSSQNTTFSVRGFGNGSNNVGVEPSVGVFIDGVYRSRSAAAISDLPNISRIEVLRGPQSTLFGKNASAGVVSVITEEAQFDWGGSVEGSYGNYNSVRLKGDITGPLSETLAFSLAASYTSRDGYATDTISGGDLNDRNRWGVRGQLQFEPTESASFRLIADYDNLDEVCCVAGNLLNGPTGGAIAFLTAGTGLNPEDPFSYDVPLNFLPSNDVTNDGISLTSTFDTNFATVTSITAFRKNEYDVDVDSDFSAADILSKNRTQTDIETFTQELRLTSNNTEGMLDWMLGVYYFDESLNVDNDIIYGADIRNYVDLLLPAGTLASIEAPLMLPTGTFYGSGQGFNEAYSQDNTAYSLFGSADFHLSDRLTFSAGLSYTNDEKDVTANLVSTDVFAGLDLNALGVAFFGPAGVNAFAALQPLQFFPPFLGVPNAVEDGHTNDDATTYSLRLAYDLDDNLNIYGSYATGFKASSWNLSRDSRPFASDFIPGSPVTNPAPSPIRDAGLALPNLSTGTRFAGPEDSAVYEIGVKGKYDTFSFNIALFDQVINDFQTNVFLGTGFAFDNAAQQSSRGLEVDTNILLSDNFSVTFAGTFMDPVYDDFKNSASGDISGQQPNGIPETQTSLAGTYTTVLSNGWDVFARADWQYTSNSPFFDDPANEALIAPFGYDRGGSLINASMGFTTETGLSVNLWGRNIFDEETISTAFPAVAQAGSISGYPNQPSTYGITVKKEF